jgi:hypothetical protein
LRIRHGPRDRRSHFLKDFLHFFRETPDILVDRADTIPHVFHERLLDAVIRGEADALTSVDRMICGAPVPAAYKPTGTHPQYFYFFP